MLPGGTYNVNYDEDIAIIRTRLQWGLTVGGLILLFTFPLYVPTSLVAFGLTTGIAVISVLGLQILTGYCGQISVGQAALMAVGAQTAAVLGTRLGVPFLPAILCAALMSGLIGLVFGLPSLKVKGFYLLMVTLAGHYIIIWTIWHLPALTGGPHGMVIPYPILGNIELATNRELYYLIMAFMVAAIFLAKNIARTKAGRAFVAVRDNDIAAEGLGISIYWYKLLAFFICSCFAGVAGALYGYYSHWVGTELFPLTDAIWYLGMIIVGGMGSITGAVVGALFIKGLEYLIIVAGPMLAATFPTIADQTFAVAQMALALVIILFLVLEPRGIYHRWEVFKTYYRLWPLPY